MSPEQGTHHAALEYTLREAVTGLRANTDQTTVTKPCVHVYTRPLSGDNHVTR